jgi:hypothetical protein
MVFGFILLINGVEKLTLFFPVDGKIYMITRKVYTIPCY